MKEDKKKKEESNKCKHIYKKRLSNLNEKWKKIQKKATTEKLDKKDKEKEM